MESVQYCEVLNGLLEVIKCSSPQELYIKLQVIAKYKLGLDGLLFSLLALEHPPSINAAKEILNFIGQCDKAAKGNNSHDDAIKLIKFLKDNPPEESYENPKLSDSKTIQDEGNLIQHIFYNGIDLPGSLHNPFGHLETYGPMDLAIKVREAHPRDKGECEKCVKPAPKQCGACIKVYYCTPACQKLDWKFHKITCHKKKERKKNK